jgi:hypothetical protein
MMIGSGFASSENKLSVGYGAGAGHMDSLIENVCALRPIRWLLREMESPLALGKLGISANSEPTRLTFEPHPHAYGAKHCAMPVGTKNTVLVLCPIHPFVAGEASLAKYVALLSQTYKSQYRTVYFHESGAEGIAVQTLHRWIVTRHAFGQSIACSNPCHGALDAIACRAIAEQIPGIPIFTSDDYDMYQLVAICGKRRTWFLRAITASLLRCPARGLCIVTMDERIRNLCVNAVTTTFALRGRPRSGMTKILRMMETLVAETESIREGIAQAVVRNLKIMARMGVV